MSATHHLPTDVAADRSGGPADGGVAERAPRTNLFLGALLLLPGTSPREVRVRNLSASGARLDLADPPARGSTALLCRGSVEVAAEVIWTEKASCGLRFSEPIEVARWMSDRPVAAAGTAIAPALAADLALARQLVARLEERLADHPQVIAALGAELQALDLITQLLKVAEQTASGAAAPEMRGIRQAALTLLRRPPVSSDFA